MIPYKFSLSNTILLTVVLAVLFSLTVASGPAIADEFADDDTYGVVSPVGTPNEDDTVVSYSELSKSDKQSFRNSEAYNSGETVKTPQYHLSNDLDGVDYIQLDGEYYYVAEQPTQLASFVESLYTITLALLLMAVCISVVGVFFTGLKTIDEQLSLSIPLFSEKYALTVFLIVLLIAGFALYLGPIEQTVTKISAVSSPPENSSVTKYKSLSWSQQYEFRESVAYQGSAKASDELQPLAGEYIQSDGEYYKVTERQYKPILALISVFIFVLFAGAGWHKQIRQQEPTR